MNATARLVTADELLMMPHRDEHGNDCRLELIRGALTTKELFSPAHGILCAKIAAILGAFVGTHGLGLVFGTGTGFLVEQNPDSVLGIDVAFVCYARLREDENLEKFLPFAPDLAVEVLIPNNTDSEIEERITFYFAAGAEAVWIFNPKQRAVAVYSSRFKAHIFGEHDTLRGGDILPGFELELSKLFDAVR